MQFTDLPETGEGVLIETIITHDSGQYISGRLYMPAAKLDPQGFGSAITYGRRYALAAALGIVSDEDNDGNGIKGKPKVDPPPKSAPQGSAAVDGASVLSEAQQSLMAELGGFCGGNQDHMAALLKEVSYYQKSDGKEGWLKIDDLRKECKVPGVQKWIGSTLGKLRKRIAEQSPGESPETCNLCQQTGGHSASCPENESSLF